MPRTTFAGHALHPQLVLLPGGLLPFSAVLDAMSLATGKREYSDAAYYTLAGGLVGGLAAGAAGAADYLTIPSESETKRTANLHAAINIGGLAMTALNLLLRSRQREGEPVGALPAALDRDGRGRARVVVARREDVLRAGDARQRPQRGRNRSGVQDPRRQQAG